MNSFTSRPRLLTAVLALSLTTGLSACGPAPVSQPTPSASVSSTPIPAPTGSAVAPSPDTAVSDELTVSVKADASLAGFATAQATPFTLCLGQIASASTRLSLPAGLPEAALNAMRSNGATVETVNGQTTATLSRSLSLADLLAGIEFKLKGVPGGAVEGRTTFFNAAGSELGFVSWRADVSATGKRVAVMLKAGSETRAGEACPKIEAEVSGAAFLGAGGQVVSTQPLPNPVTTPSPSPSAEPAPGAAPAQPINAAVVEQTSTSLTLQWEFPPDARSFNLYLDGTQVASGYVTPNYYRFEGLRESTTYRLGVQSVNDSGSSEIVTLTTATINGHSASGNFSGGGSSRPRPRPSASSDLLEGEFLVNAYTFGVNVTSAVARDADGDFVVVWVNQSENAGDIKARIFDKSGNPLSSEFTVNTYTSDLQTAPDVAMDADGNFVVVWASNGQDGDGNGIFARHFEAGSSDGGDEFRVNEVTSSSQTFPAVAMDDEGDFVVAWTSSDGNGNGVFARNFEAGSETGPSEFQVNQTIIQEQDNPDVAMDADGDFTITWSSKYFNLVPGGPPTFIPTILVDVDVFARSYPAGSSNGASEFQVNDNLVENSNSPAIGMDDEGDFTITWLNATGSFAPVPSAVRAKSFATGDDPGEEFAVVVNAGSQSFNSPALAMDGEGDFTITWNQIELGDAILTPIMAQQYAAGATVPSSEFQVNVYTTTTQSFSSVAMDADGDLVITWTTDGTHPLAYESGILGRLYEKAE